MSDEQLRRPPHTRPGSRELATKDHPAVRSILRWFSHQHLPGHLRATAKGFSDLAHELVEHLPPDPETTVALRKLLEAKDAAVRARLVRDMIEEAQAQAEAAAG